MRRVLLLLLVALLLPMSAALADKTVTITFTGDVTLGCEDYLRADPASFSAVYAKEGPAYFLRNMKDFFAEDDLTIVNLEGVLTDNDNLLPADKGRGGDGYWFRGPTEYVQVLTEAGVEAVTLANNHTMDYGEAGIQDTVNTLEKAGIAWFGTRDKNKTNTEQFYIYEKDGVRVAFMSLYWDNYRQGDADGCGAWMSKQITALKEEGKADAVVCILHGGQEYGRHRTRPQTVFTAMALRAGADLVICHHAHVVMGMDVINNRSAFYSLGNFCFGGNRNAYQLNGAKSKVPVQDAAPALVVRATLTFEDDGTYKGQQMTLYPVQTTGVDRVGDEQKNDYQPKFINGSLAAHVLHLMQIDMAYDDNHKDQANRDLKAYIIAEEERLKAVGTTQGQVAITLPYLPAEGK